MLMSLPIGLIMGALIKYTSHPRHTDVAYTCPINVTNTTTPTTIYIVSDNVTYAYKLSATYNNETPHIPQSGLVDRVSALPSKLCFKLIDNMND